MIGPSMAQPGAPQRNCAKLLLLYLGTLVYNLIFTLGKNHGGSGGPRGITCRVCAYSALCTVISDENAILKRNDTW